MANESIILDGQKLTGEDHFGIWKTTGLDGWWSSPEPKGENVAREGSDGDFDLAVYYDARYPTLTGTLRARSHEQQHQAINRFTALVRKKSRLQVIGHGPAQWADVVRASGFKMEPLTDTLTQWQAKVKAPDPRKYGEVNRFTSPSGATTLLFHRGNYDAWPSFTITGNMPGYTLRIGGRAYTVLRPLTSGSHVVNFRDGRLRVNGTPVSGGVGTANLTPIPPGSGANFQLEPVSGSGSASITVYDTYI